MRLRVVGDLIAHSRLEREGSAICQFGIELSFRAQKDMALHAPVIRKVSRRVLDHSNSDIAELACPPVGFARLTWMFGSWDRRPVCRSERNAMHLHRILSLVERVRGARLQAWFQLSPVGMQGMKVFVLSNA